MDTLDGHEVRDSDPRVVRRLTMSCSIIQIPRRGGDYNLMQRLLSDLQQHPQAWAFLQPVNGDEVEDYYDVIKRPMGSSCSLVCFVPNI